MSRQDDIKLALWAGEELKSEKDPLFHGQPTIWGDLGHTSYIPVAWYTMQDTDARKPTIYEAITSAILEIC